MLLRKLVSALAIRMLVAHMTLAERAHITSDLSNKAALGACLSFCPSFVHGGV